MLRRTATPSRSGRHVKKWQLRLTYSYGIKITLRYFRTDKTKRSKLTNQLVLPLKFMPFKELVLTKTRQRRKNRTLAPIWFREQGLTPILITLGLSGLIYFGSAMLMPNSLEPVYAWTSSLPMPIIEEAPQPKYPAVLARAEPLYLRVPRIGISSPLAVLGLKLDGSMEAPADYDIAGWYRYSPTPGEGGPAIIVGHVDSIHGPAVFWRLRELVPGDIIEIDRADYTTAKFKVYDIKQFLQDELPAEEIYGSIDHSEVRLITCGGVFDKRTQHYSHNTVVFGRLITD